MLWSSGIIQKLKVLPEFRIQAQRGEWIYVQVNVQLLHQSKKAEEWGMDRNQSKRSPKRLRERQKEKKNLDTMAGTEGRAFDTISLEYDFELPSELKCAYPLT